METTTKTRKKRTAQTPKSEPVHPNSKLKPVYPPLGKRNFGWAKDILFVGDDLFDDDDVPRR